MPGLWRGSVFTAVMRWTTGRAIDVAILGLNENEGLSAGDAAVSSSYPFKPRIVVVDLKSNPNGAVSTNPN
jgi:hypothetical protein